MTGCSNEQKNQEEKKTFKQMREEMVKRQIEARGVKDKDVLQAMLTVPRHLFVPEDERTYSYRDEPRYIGDGQTISQPYIVAFMTEQLNVKKGDRVLEIGTGSGYQAAVLAQIVDTVYTIEIIERLALKAQSTLNELGYTNIVVKFGDGYVGWKEKAPFDAIIVTAAPSTIPPPLLEQLKEGGRMILPVGEVNQELIVVDKTANGHAMKSVLPVRFVPMTGKIQEKK